MPDAIQSRDIEDQVDEFEVAVPSPPELMKRRAKSHRGFIIGGSVVIFFLLVAVFAPVLAPFDPYDQDLTRRLIPPVWDAAKGTWEHPFGTDALGRDYLTRLMYGAQISLMIGFFAAAVSAIVGSCIGMIGGYFGGRIDNFVMYLINVKLALPGLLVALSLVSVFGGSILALILILSFLFWDRYAVVTRSVTQQIRVNDYITAAQALGTSRTRIIISEVLPNVMNQIIVIASLEMAVAIIVEAALSFLGLGVQPPTPSWGLLLSEGRSYMFFMPYLINFPGLAIFFLVISINMMGDGIRDITAPEGRN
ncbi:MAG: ABC transporter permease [Rhodospirillales bacterium]|jgi:peptide/nickel transport system permease protein|nr:ABC transporter permease [Rhodospirillales bacterium]MDP7423798.1 ABC transporter permease [Rhodospirillales bacterium]MDP7600437.1 ABC transporter permease [Rhodospirillales bacterium]MDP7623433.1 ABC transporter permease [Rhodospirillales bacterium]|tara:strand:+ start:7669 stop:8592 length:924 start_codon:yes stop_codon:yes gene_type:complete